MAPAGNSGPNGAAPPEARPNLKYQRRSIWISTLYLPLLVIPWVITCVMMFRPVRQSSYGDHVGTDLLTDPDVQEMERWLMAAKVMSTIATVLGLPVISALLAQAAVRYSQRRRKGQALSLAQLFTLANRGWADLPVLFRAWEDGRLVSSLLCFGGLLVFVTLIQPPIQSLMIRYEPTSIATCQDVPETSDDGRGIGYRYGCRLNETALVERQRQRWYDPDPGDLEKQPQGLVISKLTSKLNNIRDSDAQTHLWPEGAPGVGYPPPMWPTLWEYTTLSPLIGIRQPDEPWAYYASSLPSGTTTGVLRYHAMRQHSAARCDNVSQSTFPTTCAGSSPLTATFVLAEFTVRICVPGASNQTAWTRSRNRQSIDEELWINVQMNQTRSARVYPLNFTTHCTSSSTRGYFELGNQRNGNTPGPLLEKWPDREELVANFNDGTGSFVRYDSELLPSEVAESRGDDSLAAAIWDVPNLNIHYPSSAWSPTPGPLMTSALALFGDTSFFFTAANATKTNYVETLGSICRSGAVPLAMFLRTTRDFRGFCYGEDEAERAGRMLLQLVAPFIFQFSDMSTAKTILDVSMFGANEIHLTTTASAGGSLWSRAIYSSPGYEILKPVKSIPGIAVVSSLLGLQVIAVVLLVVYNSSFPTWTASLDALVMAKMGAGLKGLGLAPLGVHDKNEVAKLAEADGVVGLVQVDKDGETDLESESAPVLGLGGSGVITRTALSDKTTKDKV